MELQNNTKGIYSKLNEVNTLQLFNLMRYGTHFLLSFILAWFCNKELIAGYETALLLSTLVSFFFISSLNQAMVSYFKKNDQTKKLIWSAFVVLVLMTGVSVVLFVLYLFFFSNAEEQKKMIRDYTIIGLALLIGLGAVGWMVWIISFSVTQ